jgi:hypothetical protein
MYVFTYIYVHICIWYDAYKGSSIHMLVAIRGYPRVSIPSDPMYMYICIYVHIYIYIYIYMYIYVYLSIDI